MNHRGHRGHREALPRAKGAQTTSISVSSVSSVVQMLPLLPEEARRHFSGKPAFANPVISRALVLTATGSFAVWACR